MDTTGAWKKTAVMKRKQVHSDSHLDLVSFFLKKQHGSCYNGNNQFERVKAIDVQTSWLLSLYSDSAKGGGECESRDCINASTEHML